MNQPHLELRLGNVSPEAFRRRYVASLVPSLAHQSHVAFAGAKTTSQSTVGPSSTPNREVTSQTEVAHSGGVNCIAVDATAGRFLVTGGGDASIRLWDLESPDQPDRYCPVASVSRANSQSHTHALTSLSIYPHDPTPTTLLSTAFDSSLRLTSITPSSLQPVHSFPLNHAPYTHALSSLPSASPLIAVGTKSPHIPLIDLRTTSSAHTLAGPNGEVYALAWSPRHEHILASGSSDGQVLFYDIRRAAPCFASLSLDDAVGVLGEPGMPAAARQRQLDYSAPAHNGAVTSIQWTPLADKIVTAGHDGRIRLWDTATGRNELVHFGPRIRNSRIGSLGPLISPAGTHEPGREVLLWPNDDGRGDVFAMMLREGNMLGILRTEGIDRAAMQAKKGGAKRAGRLTSGGRINALAWRWRAESGEGIEMYSAHGDGRVGAWTSSTEPAGDAEGDGDDEYSETAVDEEEAERERRRKRKRDLIGDLVQGLAKKPIMFAP